MACMRCDQGMLYYELIGQEGPVLVLCAGLGCDHTVFAPLVGDLAQSYRVLLFDNRGSGRTDLPLDGLTIPTMADDLIMLLDALKLEHVHLLGHSMGGMVAQDVAFRFPERVARLILYSSCARSDRLPLMQFEALGYCFEHDVPLEIAWRLMMTLGMTEAFCEDEAAVARFIKVLADQPHPQSLEAYRAQLKAYAAFDGRDRLASIAQPTALIEGALDRIAPPHNQQVLFESLPQVQRFIHPDQGHNSHMEVPTWLLEQVHAFLS